MGGLALADFMAGALAALSVVAGLAARDGEASGIEVSLLGAALTLQAQRFVAIAASEPAPRAEPLTADGLIRAARARPSEQAERLDPYYRAYACGDGGFVALACLNAPQRRSVCAIFDLDDPFVDDPTGRARRFRRAGRAPRVTVLALEERFAS